MTYLVPQDLHQCVPHRVGYPAPGPTPRHTGHRRLARYRRPPSAHNPQSAGTHVVHWAAGHLWEAGKVRRWRYLASPAYRWRERPTPS